jgi:hypothetical protein
MDIEQNRKTVIKIHNYKYLQLSLPAPNFITRIHRRTRTHQNASNRHISRKKKKKGI